jgi:hypothetical protein
MTAVEDAGESLSIVLDVQGTNWRGTTHWSRGHGAGEGSGRQRSGEVDRRRYAGGKEREHASVGPAAGLTHMPAISALRTQPARKLAGKMVKNTKILGEFRRFV